MTSMLEDVLENEKHKVPCPACPQSPGLADRMSNQMGPGSNGVHKRGRYKGLKRSAMPSCQFCQGLKFVYTNRICQCGMPAVAYDRKDKVWHCGSHTAQACINHAVMRRMPSGGGWHHMDMGG